jgi:hypothetical protein
MRIALLFLALFVGVLQALAQPDPDTLWTRMHYDHDMIREIIPNGNGFLAITSTDLLWIDQTGTISQSHRYWQIDSLFISLRAVGVLSDGRIVLAGSGQVGDAILRAYAVVFTVESTGAIQWSRVYGIPEAISNGFRDFIVTDQDEIVAVGSASQEAEFSPSTTVVRLAADGNIIGEYYLDRAFTIAYSVNRTADGDFMICGLSEYSVSNYTGRLWIARFGQTGDIQWQWESELQVYRVFPRMRPVSQSRHVVVATHYNFNLGEHLDPIIASINEDGTFQWFRELQSPSMLRDVFEAHNGTFVAVGTSFEDFCQAQDRLYLGAFSSDGDSMWSQWYDVRDWRTEFGNAVCRTEDNGYLIGGGYGDCTTGTYPDPFYSYLIRTGPDVMTELDKPIPIAGSFTLSAYPNPFNPATTITFSLSQQSPVCAVDYNRLGQEVLTLVDESMKAGNHELIFDGSKLTSGLYFVRVTAGNETNMVKAALIK